MKLIELSPQIDNIFMPKIWQLCAFFSLLLISSLLFIDDPAIKYGIDTCFAILSSLAIISIFYTMKRSIFPWGLLVFSVILLNMSFVINALIFYGFNFNIELSLYLEISSIIILTLFGTNLLYLLERQYKLKGITIDFSLILLSIVLFVFILSPDLLNRVLNDMNAYEKSIIFKLIAGSLFLTIILIALTLSRTLKTKDILLGMMILSLSIHIYLDAFIAFEYLKDNTPVSKISWFFYQLPVILSLLYISIKHHEYNFDPARVKTMGVKFLWLATIIGALTVPFTVSLRWLLGFPNIDTIIFAAMGGVMTLIVICRIVILISNYEKQRQKLRSSAFTDSLTGLFNYFGLQSTVPKLMNTFLLSINIEDFKSINDMYDRKFGDAVLISLANRIENAQGVLYSARTTGDNFIAIFQAEEHDIQKTFDVFAKEVGLWDTVFNRKVAVPLTYGGSHSYKPEAIDVLTNNAEQALKQSRILKRHFTLYKNPEEKKTSTTKAELPRHELREILQHSIDKNELPIHFQPIYKTRTGDLKALEMLIRVDSIKHGLLQPGQFLEQAKSYGLLTELTHTCVDMIAKQIHTLPNVIININLPPYMLDDNETLGNFIAYFKSRNLSAKRFCIEVTEDGDISTDKLIPAIQQLKKEGFSIAMDDFGTGYSSLGRLSSLPFDTVKIDRSLLLAADNGDRTILESAITLVKRLGVSVVVEGVETLEQLALVRELGADSVQGFLFSKPIAVTNPNQFPMNASKFVSGF